MRINVATGIKGNMIHWPKHKHITPKCLNSPYLLRTMPEVFIQPIRTLEFFAQTWNQRIRCISVSVLQLLCLANLSMTSITQIVHPEPFTMFNYWQRNVSICLLVVGHWHVCCHARALWQVQNHFFAKTLWKKSFHSISSFWSQSTMWAVKHSMFQPFMLSCK